ncbi:MULTISPECIES: ATP-binding protein [unclassified Methylibium]|uniref:sensor histidine kinase n=1 Tax=unclassified Methylibium TaxID=2633235 RepID=UPI0003F46177|nr:MULTISPECIES: ATP-binding protein [unclassified Methylibium]EWS56059.1 Sensor protein QseC [Methylibium sp. T29]EWS60456.1 Sensor protein QseC [Methylibium sp. T29-B]
MSALPSIRGRLSAALIGVSLAWGVAVSAAVGWVVRHEVDELLDNTLQESAEILMGLLVSNATLLPTTGERAMPAPPHDEQMVWQVVDASGRVMLRSHRAPDAALGPAATLGFSDQGRAWRVFTLPLDAEGRKLHVAQRAAERHEARFDAIKYPMGTALAIGLLGSLWLRLRVTRELEPIERMSKAIAQFDPMLPGQALIGPARSELAPVHRAITGLSSRLARQVANERAFAAHAAHALRTPLAAMVANLAVAQRHALPIEQTYLKRARESADRLRRVVTALLTMFRSGGEVNRQPVDVDQLVSELPFGSLAVVTRGTARVKADPDLLAAAFMNLLDNALRHGATSVVISLQHDDHATLIRLKDDGSGLAEPDRQRIQAALDVQDYDGNMGLGLMLSDMVARAHGGRLRLVPAASGFAVEMSLG